MALRNQPYLPLYVQDYLTDEKLNECSAETQGVYIKLMCLMHKSKKYGTILLKQKDKQTESKVLNFACKLANHLTFNIDLIEKALNQLIEEEVLVVDGDYLLQKRMVKDGLLSEKRAIAGKKGGCFAQAKYKANVEANPEDENENENKDVIKDKKEKKKKHGEHKNVLLTNKELEKLKDDFGEALALSAIEFLSDGIALKGYKYKSHYLCLRKWPMDEAKKKAGTGTSKMQALVDETMRRYGNAEG